jgi:hypothetical protein
MVVGHRASASCETRPRHPANSLALLGRLAGVDGTQARRQGPSDSTSGHESLGISDPLALLGRLAGST